MPVIYNGEIEENSMLKWLSTLALHTYTVREDGPSTRSSTRSEFGRATVAIQIANEESLTPSDSPNNTLTDTTNSVAEADK